MLLCTRGYERRERVEKNTCHICLMRQDQEVRAELTAKMETASQGKRENRTKRIFSEGVLKVRRPEVKSLTRRKSSRLVPKPPSSLKIQGDGI